MVSKMWKELAPAEREKYDEMARQDRARYDREKASYTGPWKVMVPLEPPKEPSRSRKRKSPPSSTSRNNSEQSGKQLSINASDTKEEPVLKRAGSSTRLTAKRPLSAPSILPSARDGSIPPQAPLVGATPFSFSSLQGTSPGASRTVIAAQAAAAILGVGAPSNSVAEAPAASPSPVAGVAVAATRPVTSTDERVRNMGSVQPAAAYGVPIGNWPQEQSAMASLFNGLPTRHQMDSTVGLSAPGNVLSPSDMYALLTEPGVAQSMSSDALGSMWKPLGVGGMQPQVLAVPPTVMASMVSAGSIQTLPRSDPNMASAQAPMAPEHLPLPSAQQKVSVEPSRLRPDPQGTLASLVVPAVPDDDDIDGDNDDDVAAATTTTTTAAAAAPATTTTTGISALQLADTLKSNSDESDLFANESRASSMDDDPTPPRANTSEQPTNDGSSIGSLLSRWSFDDEDDFKEQGATTNSNSSIEGSNAEGNDTEQHNTEQRNTEQHNTEQHNTEQHGIVDFPSLDRTISEDIRTRMERVSENDRGNILLLEDVDESIFDDQ